MSSLLPSQYALRERALEAAAGERLNALVSPALTLWDADNCPADHLPQLAAALSVDFWYVQDVRYAGFAGAKTGDDWPEAVKRQMVKQAPELHRLKGTPAGLIKALAILGYGHSYLREFVAWKHDGTFTRNGAIAYGQTLTWYQFDVYLQAGAIPDANTLNTLRRYIQAFKPTHARLRRIYYASCKHNGQHQRDGQINYDGGLSYGGH